MFIENDIHSSTFYEHLWEKLGEINEEKPEKEGDKHTTTISSNTRRTTDELLLCLLPLG